MIRHYIATGLGGGVGAIMRLLISNLLPLSVFGIPLPILVVNVVGCFIMGVLTEFMAFYWSPSDTVRYFLISGILGGFTTFSAFSLEFGLLFQKNQFVLSFLYITLSVLLSLVFFFVGMKIVRLF
ncbi:MAG: fluoride efflux transporter CrcB [Gammaproteobacteria bacterium]|nr:fluoride efflux transporter CrcB [Gammaproteobacteria bacterium]